MKTLFLTRPDFLNSHDKSGTKQFSQKGHQKRDENGIVYAHYPSSYREKRRDCGWDKHLALSMLRDSTQQPKREREKKRELERLDDLMTRYPIFSASKSLERNETRRQKESLCIFTSDDHMNGHDEGDLKPPGAGRTKDDRKLARAARRPNY